MRGNTLRIGAVAELAAVNVQTLRYYERRGLLAQPARTPSGYREYAPDTPDVVRFIKRAQELGFTLDEVQELLRLRAAPARDRARIRKIAQAKIADIDGKVARLVAVRDSIASLVECCENGEALRCSIIDALNGECG
jgi:MerR family mercuric resistance operon transcriptional regulator